MHPDSTNEPLTFKQIEQLLDAHEVAAVALGEGTGRDADVQAARDAIWAELERLQRVQELCTHVLAADNSGPLPEIEDPTPIPGWVTLVQNAISGKDGVQ